VEQNYRLQSGRFSSTRVKKEVALGDSEKIYKFMEGDQRVKLQSITIRSKDCECLLMIDAEDQRLTVKPLKR
jgi:hypothetical protein